MKVRLVVRPIPRLTRCEAEAFIAPWGSLALGRRARSLCRRPQTMAPLRIVSWNIGLRGLDKLCNEEADSGGPDTHGICRRAGFGGLPTLLRDLGYPDILCLQEVKLRQLGALERNLALADGYESYFGLCRIQTPSTSFGRYAGVATFCKMTCQAHRAEEGVTGSLASPQGAATVDPLDGEGRCVVTVHGDLAVLNVYAPAVTSSDPAQAERRAEYKAAFFAALERRCRDLLADGLRVLAIGDFNVAPEPIDSARELEAGGRFSPQGSPSRAWLQQLLRPTDAAAVPFVDAFRELHPQARHAYSCFHVAAGADAFNYGSRIDLALLAPPPLLTPTQLATSASPAVCATPTAVASCAGSGRVAAPLTLDSCGIDTAFQGSDHQPLWLVLRGVTLPATPPSPPALASSVRLRGQALISGFFGNASQPSSTHSFSAAQPSSTHSATAATATLRPSAARLPSAERVLGPQQPAPVYSSHPTSGVARDPTGATAGLTEGSSSRPEAPPTSYLLPPTSYSLHPTRPRTEAAPIAPPQQLSQTHLAGFFQAVPTANGIRNASTPMAVPSTTNRASAARSKVAPAAPTAPAAPSRSTVHDWQQLFSRAEAKVPLCKHCEPCKKQTVRKAGGNQGRTFYSCVRSEGPKSNPEANCGQQRGLNLTPSPSPFSRTLHR